MSIIEHNKMTVAANILEPPQETISFAPTKDALLTKEYPVFSFGKYSANPVKYSATKENKVIMSFTFKIEEEHLPGLMEAGLELKFQKKPDRNVTLQLRQHEDDGWPENGTTWAGQPVEYTQILGEQEIPTGASSYTFDITDLVKNLGAGEHILAFTVSEAESDGEQDSPIYIGARESQIFCPRLYYTYEYFPEAYDVTNLDTSLTVRRSDFRALPARLKIKGGSQVSDFPVSININSHPGSADLSCSIIPCPVIVDDTFHGEIVIQRNVPNPIEKAPDLFSVLSVAKHDGDIDIQSSITVNNYEGTPLDIDAQLKIRCREDLSGHLSIVKKEVSSDLPVIFGVKKDAYDELPGNLEVRLHEGEPSGILSSLTVRRYPVFSGPSADPQIPSSLVIKTKNKDTDISSSLTVKPNGYEDLPCSLDVTYIKAESDGIHGSLMVRGKAELPASMVVQHKDKVDLDVSMKVRPAWANDLSCGMKVVPPAYNYAFIS